MILQLLLVLAAFRVTEGKQEKCPEDLACLYHYRCHDSSLSDDDVFVTTNPDDFEKWLTNCRGTTSALDFFVRPLSNHKWNLTLVNTVLDVGISFGDSLAVMTNQTEATFKSDSDAATKIPLEKEMRTLRFTVEYFEKKLLDIFKDTNISYTEKDMKNGSTSSNQPQFWQRVHQLTPCNDSLIIDDCNTGMRNCSALNYMDDSIQCQGADGTMWLKSANSTWRQLDSVSCDSETKEWSLTSNGTSVGDMRSGEIVCATEEPEPWAVSATGLRVNDKVKKIKEEEEEKKTKFSFLDSPYTWVLIGLVGLISMGAVVLGSVYACRKIRKNPGAGKSSKSKVGFTALPQQEPSATGTSASNSEADLGNEKVEQPSSQQSPLPTPTPSTASKTPAVPQSAPPASRIDGPTADTVNRLSMIKSMRDSKMEPLPAPTPN